MFADMRDKLLPRELEGLTIVRQFASGDTTASHGAR